MKIYLIVCSFFLVGCSSLVAKDIQVTPNDLINPAEFNSTNSRSPSNSSKQLEGEAKGLVSNLIGLGNDRINIERYPWLCSTRDPWNSSYESYSTTESSARDLVIGKCGIFKECKTNVNCVNRKNKQVTDSPARQDIVETTGPVIIERCTGDANDLRDQISRLSSANDSLADSFNTLKRANDQLSKSYKALYEMYIGPKQTDKDKIILACANKFKFESEVSDCVKLAVKLNASTGDIGFCGTYTEYYHDFSECLGELKINNISPERFEVCRKVGKFWTDRRSCLKY